MPALAQRNDQFIINGSSGTYTLSTNGFWSKHRDDVSYNQLQKFWSELSPQAGQELLRIDKQTLFEEARKNMYCSRCNGLLLEGFLQIVMYGKSLQQEGACGSLPCNKLEISKYQANGGSGTVNGCQDEVQDPSVHPWGGLTTTRDGSLTLMDCYLYSNSLMGLQNVFDSARARERERELLYPDACGGGGRGWISQGIASYGRGHGARETCALHTTRLSCDTLVDFWSALGEETRQSLLRMKEEDFIERLMYRFDSKRFCRDCRRNVIREFKELKELKRMRRQPRCTSWFCGPDTAFQYEVSDDRVQADWRQTFSDTVGTYHHFEWAVGTGEGKSDILEFENVGMNGSVKVNGLNLGGLSSCFITLRAWKQDGRCTELSVKAHALKGQQCAHCRLIVGDGFVTITRGESIRRFFEHAEEAEEEEDDDSMDKDGNDLDGECTRPQKHAKSPELAREFLLDAATVIFKEQVEKAFREGTARQNAHSIFVCLALKLLEERVHVACKEIVTLEKQMKLLEEEEKEKCEEEERKERRRTKEREKKLRRKERLKGKEKEKDKKCSELTQTCVLLDVSKEDVSPSVDEESNNSTNDRDSSCKADDSTLFEPASAEISDEQFLDAHNSTRIQNSCHDSPDAETTNLNDGNGSLVEQSKFSRRVQLDQSLKWSDRRQSAVVTENGPPVTRCEPRYFGDNFETPSRNGNITSNRQLRTNAAKSSYVSRNGHKFNEKLPCASYRYDSHSCCCNQNSEYRAKTEPYGCSIRVNRDVKATTKSEQAYDMSKQFYRGNRYNKIIEYTRDGLGRSKSKAVLGSNASGKDSLYSKKVWEPMESQKKYPRSNSESDVTLGELSNFRVEGGDCDNNPNKSVGGICAAEISENLEEVDREENNSKESPNSGKNGLHVGPKDHAKLSEPSFREVKSSNGKTFDSVRCSPSNSDNCSSCLSEGDSNSASSSNHGNLESSSSTSDSEDSQQSSEGRESSTCIQNGFSEHHKEGAAEKSNGGDHLKVNQIFPGLSESGVKSNPLENNINPSTKIAPAINPHPQNQGVLPPIRNQNIHYPMFQSSSPTMGYYRQNPVPWTTGPTNGLMSFPHPNQYLYPSPLGYNVDGNSPFCLPYSPLQHLATTPLFNPGPVPLYQPIAKSSSFTVDEQIATSKPGPAQEGSNEANPVRADSSPKSQVDGAAFSLFLFGGPVALSSTGMTGFHEGIQEDRVEGDQAFNKETTIEEYNLFAASNRLRFSFF